MLYVQLATAVLAFTAPLGRMHSSKVAVTMQQGYDNFGGGEGTRDFNPNAMPGDPTQQQFQNAVPFSEYLAKQRGGQPQQQGGMAAPPMQAAPGYNGDDGTRDHAPGAW